MTDYEMMMDELFEGFMVAEGFTAWWATEDRWEDWEMMMVAAGVPADLAADYFSDLAWEI